jgi:hypothetical protein
MKLTKIALFFAIQLFLFVPVNSQTEVKFTVDSTVFDSYWVDSVEIGYELSRSGKAHFNNMKRLYLHRKETGIVDTAYFKDKNLINLFGAVAMTSVDVRAYSNCFMLFSIMDKGMQASIMVNQYNMHTNRDNHINLFSFSFPPARPNAEAIFDPFNTAYYHDYAMLGRDTIVKKTYVPVLPEVFMVVNPMSGTGTTYPSVNITDEMRRMYAEKDTLIEVRVINWEASPILDPNEIVEHPISHERVPRRDVSKIKAPIILQKYTSGKK